jgi:hypothetical protein
MRSRTVLILAMSNQKLDAMLDKSAGRDAG